MFQFWSDLWRVLPKIRKENYDAVLFLRASGGNFVFTGPLMNAKFLAGHAAGGGANCLDAVADWHVDRHETEHFGEVIRLLPISLSEMPLPFFTGSDELLENLPVDFVCVHPGAGADNKKLSSQVWHQILSVTDQPIVVCGTPAESGWLSSLGLPTARKTIDLTKANIPIPQLFQIFSSASVVHALDSFPAHLAAASKCPKVIVHFLPTSDPVQWRPLGHAVEVVLHSSN